MAGINRQRQRQSIGNYSQNWLLKRDDYVVGEGEYSQTYSPVRASCTDVVGNRGFPNPLYLESEITELINYTIQTRVEWTEDDGFQRSQEQYLTGSLSHQYLTYDGSGNDVEFVTAAVAATNPSAADFDVPVFIGELRDVPSLFKNAAERLSKAGADELLKFEYGWKPLVSDIRKMLGFSERLQRRFDNISRLEHKHFITRTYRPKENVETIIFDESQYYDLGGIGTPSLWGYLYSLKGGGRVTIERWVTVKWMADPLSSAPRGDEQLLSLAKRAAAGMTIDGSTAWELMPWSWLIDWNTNMSEFIASKRNIVGASPVEICLMKTTTYYASVYLARNGLSAPPGVTIDTCVSTPAFTRYVTKERIIDLEPAAVITGEINLLGDNVRKQSILSALSIQRLQRLKPPRL